MTLPGPNPLLATPRTSRPSYGPAVGRLAAAMGKPLMPWQQYAADVGLEVDADGRFVYQQVIVTVPRQSGKTTLFGAVMVHRAAIVPRARVWFTQQSQKDAVDWMTNELWPLLSGFGPLAHLRRMAGSEHVRWEATQGLVRPFPPTPAGLHGKISDLVVIDECWAFDVYRGPALDQAIVPTTATRPNAQTWKLSTAGDSASGWWLGTVEQGRAAARHGRTDGVAYIEYGCPDTLDPTDPVSWPLYHPAYGRTIGTSSMQAALDMLGPDEFGRAYGNRWRARSRWRSTSRSTAARRRSRRRGGAKMGGRSSSSPTAVRASPGWVTGSASWSTVGGRSRSVTTRPARRSTSPTVSNGTAWFCSR